MKVDLNIKLFSLKDQPLNTMEKVGDATVEVQMTLGSVCYDAMLTLLSIDKGEAGKYREERWQLARRVVKAEIAGEPIDLSTEEIVMLKKRIGEMYSPSIVGPTYELLEGKEEGKDNDGNG